MIAAVPDVNMKASTWTTAPSANRKNEVPAATQGDPPSSFGSIPNSSRGESVEGRVVVGHDPRGQRSCLRFW